MFHVKQKMLDENFAQNSPSGTGLLTSDRELFHVELLDTRRKQRSPSW
jgi:hypothetical protein